jgi:hypothetical protein
MIFISHDFDDLVSFQNVADALETAGIAYFPPETMHTGVSLSLELRRVIQSSEACVFVATRNSVRSQWCLAELGAFWGSGKPVLIFYADDQLHDQDLPPYLHGILYERRIKKIVDSVKNALLESKPSIPIHEQISGHWWEHISRRGEKATISFMEIHSVAVRHSVHLKGTAYYPDTTVKGWWKSVGACVNSESNELFYYWQGEEVGPPNDHYGGFGVLSFFSTPSGINRGSGFFWRCQLIDCATNTRQLVEAERASPKDIETMASRDTYAIKKLLLKKIRGRDRQGA